MNSVVKKIFTTIENQGGKAYFTGGFVRDHILGVESKDIDIEVFGLSYENLKDLLGEFGNADLVGKKFGVIKLSVDGQDFDFNLPRRDSKNGIGHKGFDIEVDHTMTIEEAAARRDFTINSMSMDINGNLIDPYGGKSDLRLRILRPTSKAFLEDETRCLRGFQFSARFNMKPNLGFMIDAHEMRKGYSNIKKEMVWEEWKKWASKGKFYSQSLKLLKEIGWHKLYPELFAIYGLEQDYKWHPEGSVEIHTGFVLDHMHEVCVRENITGDGRLVLIFAALCHDFGKPLCTKVEFKEKYNREVITSRGHEGLGVPLAESFLTSINCPVSIIERVLPLVANHMATCNVPTDKSVKRLSNRLGKATIRELCFLIEADQCGRPPLPKVKSENLKKLIDKAEQHGIMEGKPDPIVRGADIVEFGYKPGPIIGKIQRKLYELQLNERFENKEQGLSRIHSFVNNL